MTRIDYLAEHPEFIPVLAPAIAKHWRPIIPEETIESRIGKLQNHMNRNTLPIGWVAHEDGEVLGTAALRQYDLEDRRDLTPWLGGVFVLPEYRRLGVGSALCRAVEEKAWSLGFEKLYLFTPDQQSLYTRLGWKESERVLWRGLEGDIMTKSGPNPAASGNGATTPLSHLLRLSRDVPERRRWARPILKS